MDKLDNIVHNTFCNIEFSQKFKKKTGKLFFLAYLAITVNLGILHDDAEISILWSWC